MKYKLPLSLFIISLGTAAQDYQSISGISYSKTDFGLKNSNVYSLSSIYYFDPKTALGPVDQFSYINKISNVSGSYSQIENLYNDKDSKVIGIGGEFFVDRFVIGGSYNKFDTPFVDDDTSLVSLGYLVNEDLLIKVTAFNPEEGDTQYSYLAKYNHQINKTDYLGLALTSDEDFDNSSITATYFTQLTGGKYFKSEMSYSDNENYGDNWRVKGQYYFNDYTSAYLQQQKGNYQELGIKHFIDENIALSAGYQRNTKNSDDIETYTLSISLQM